MLRRQSVSENEVVSFILQKSKESEGQGTDCFGAKTWLLLGKSIVSKNFHLQYEAFLLEKRLKNVESTAYCFEQLFRRFGGHIREDVSSIANAVRICNLTKGKESEQQAFLQEVFSALSKDVQIEVLLQCTQQTSVLFEKCQVMLLLVKLYPDTINQKNGGELLFTLLACESDAFSTFRKLLVCELVPSVLTLSQSLTASPQVITLLNQCVEYYVLVAGSEKRDGADENSRWDELYNIVDKIGSVLQWNISPFFRGVALNSGGYNVESLYQALHVAFQHKNHYSASELAYITAVVFLRCIVAYNELLNNCSSSKFGEKSKLTLVEVFAPRPHRNARPDPKLPILTTVSNCSSVGGNQSQVLQHFITAVKIWDMIMAVKGERVELEFFEVLYSMKSLDLRHWNVFQEFTIDYCTYIGQPFPQDGIVNPLKIASLNCSLNNFKSATEYAIKGVSEALQQETSNVSTNSVDPRTGVSHLPLCNSSSFTDFSFYSSHVYKTDSKGEFIYQRRVHFLSENRSEVIAYAANILIRCFQESVDVAFTSNDDRCVGHLMTLLQIEWPSPPAEIIFSYILESIRRNRSFRYFPFFTDFVIEPDFLEQFMAIANHEDKTVQLDLFSSPASGASAVTRRMGTRGLEKGSKTEFKTGMQRQMMKNGRENLETLIIKFLTLNKADILSCFD